MNIAFHRQAQLCLGKGWATRKIYLPPIHYKRSSRGLTVQVRLLLNKQRGDRCFSAHDRLGRAIDERGGINASRLCGRNKAERLLRFPGEAEKVSSRDGDDDIHREQLSRNKKRLDCIHVYGGNKHRRHSAVYTPKALQTFCLRYSAGSNRHLPNIWDLSRMILIMPICSYHFLDRLGLRHKHAAYGGQLIDVREELFQPAPRLFAANLLLSKLELDVFDACRA